MQITPNLAEIIGIHLGDGCISVNKRYAEYYLGGDITEEKDYHDNWVGPLFNKEIMIPLFNKQVVYKEYFKVGVYAFYIFNRDLVKFFTDLGIKSGKKINVDIPLEIKENIDLGKRFIRGLFDTDGTIYFNKNYSAKSPIHNQPRIRIASISESLMNQTFDILKNIGFSPRREKPYKGKNNEQITYIIMIHRKKDVLRYIQEVGFKNPKHLTKWLVYEKWGKCPPYSSLKQRKEWLENPKLFNAFTTI